MSDRTPLVDDIFGPYEPPERKHVAEVTGMRRIRITRVLMSYGYWLERMHPRDSDLLLQTLDACEVDLDWTDGDVDVFVPMGEKNRAYMCLYRQALADRAHGSETVARQKLVYLALHGHTPVCDALLESFDTFDSAEMKSWYYWYNKLGNREL